MKSAQSLTQSSPVVSTANLALWLETTLDKSFADNEKIANVAVSSWNDINPHNSSPKNATQPGASIIRPKYTINGINGLPVLNFDGADDRFILPDGTVPYGNSPYSIFLVSRTNTFCTCVLLGSGTYGSVNEVNAFVYSASGKIVNYWWLADIATGTNVVTKSTAQIFNANYNQSLRTIYVDGTLKTSLASSNRSSTAINNTVGVTDKTQFWNGDIAEVIIFDRALKGTERDSINSYLKSKWGIK